MAGVDEEFRQYCQSLGLEKNVQKMAWALWSTLSKSTAEDIQVGGKCLSQDLTLPMLGPKKKVVCFL